MRFGIVILPQDPWSIGRRKWMLAEELGFDHAWTYDHLSWRSLADEPWGATLPTLTAAAVVTSHIRLGTFVSSPNFRHPVPFAKEIATLDDVSGGRFTLGVGSGGTGFDAFVLGQAALSPRQRHERFTEFVELLDELLRFEPAGDGSAGDGSAGGGSAGGGTAGGPAGDGAAGDATAAAEPCGISRSGEWFTAHEARMVGVPAQTPRVPFVLAANGPKGLALVSRIADGWVTTGADGATGEDWWRAVTELSGRLDDAAAAAGRDPRSIDRYLSLDSGGVFSLESVGAFEELAGRASDLGFTDVISHWPRASGIYAGDEDVLVEVASRLATYRSL
ncbi:LLM class flavin-dependent oxidoreductase [Subtercola endophyticus]|uniref:LLM class flavin-dependent oxidoreductase n=1 Tax=Subtercola endophyticus TaxID=2895559 RepID=UPI001E37BEB2|nr:LLM class flavin-dependent oxidoreductase [Subtercola endophyticus]UFS57424.1 LLM class flavin-dependent oxidoreductase [Subtercola endophyticus]